MKINVGHKISIVIFLIIVFIFSAIEVRDYGADWIYFIIQWLIAASIILFSGNIYKELKGGK
jgi:heme O synthase-like polyprenyltransferase